MFEGFFYRLRGMGIPVSPTTFLRLQQALGEGLVASLEDFYVVARSILIKRERHFDIYDKVFANYFKGKEIDEDFIETLAADLQALLREWLDNPSLLPFLSAEERAKVRARGEDVDQRTLPGQCQHHDRHGSRRRGHKPAILLTGDQLRPTLEPATDRAKDWSLPSLWPDP